jgi:1,4-alpha-glucan branching enzyme
MDLLPLDRLGARQTAPGTIDFGVFLPWVSAQQGNRVRVKLIHERDQFIQSVSPEAFELTHSIDPVYGDYWAARAVLADRVPQTPRSAWGTPGTYIYRFQIQNPNVGTLDWIVDPFAREYGIGKMSAITLDYQAHAWNASEDTWKVPQLRDLIFYELMLDEFGDGVDGTIARLDYLADLGINCIEIMPISNVSMNVDWGFLPIGYFGVDERFGNRSDLQRLIEAAHQRGIAVVLDSVYGHTGSDFPYCDLYRRLQYRENPFLGAFAKDYFGESTDFARKFTRDFFYTVNHHWLSAYHVDGFRYDCVPNYWDGPLGDGYANLVYNTYRHVQSFGGSQYWSRFRDGDGNFNLIQCAEQLEAPAGVLNESVSNSTWQNETLNAARSVAHAEAGALTNLGFRLGLEGLPAVKDHGDGIVVAKSALQYIENHDHERFVNHFGTLGVQNDLFREGDRSQWFKVQPYLIALFCAQGLPMLWQGQEFGENYWVPDGGVARVMLFRPVRWDYFYDEIGRATIGLVRKLISLRRRRGELRRGSYYFHNDEGGYQARGVLVFSRREAGRVTVVALNFSGADQTVPFRFSVAGDYVEQLHGNAADAFPAVHGGATRDLVVPSNYGRVWSSQ